MTTNEQLLAIIKEHGLTSSRVAELCQVQPVTVEHWRQTLGGVGYRKMSAGLLELLKIKLGDK